ncbi:MAG: aminotransferase class I/II-fold pyridoxal phosphate-dependent enzyme [Planctomycetes bacterium]|nr:aminotransferase class I/II-fold pyridoxal phosphate-dependent enzyme [Planctomycetota bacterium]
MHNISDFRSDTVTLPTPAMREAMAKAELDDDVLGTEPTVNRLEAMTADLLGKEAGLFVPSGTMGNQIAIALHAQRGQEVICEFAAHTYNNESGALALIAGAQVRPIHGSAGVMDPAHVEALIRPANIHNPRTALITVENTHNAAGGTIVPLANIRALAETARKHHLKYHLDGARLWNAHVSTGVALKDWCAPFDTVNVCLSKGLCSPVGSVLVGSRDDIERGRYLRKQLGGGMRQSGILAACGIVSISSMIERLKDDHSNARKLAEGLARLPGVQLDLSTVQTNIIYFSVPGREAQFPQWLDKLKQQNTLAMTLGNRWRLVTHNDVDAQDCERALGAFKALLA